MTSMPAGPAGPLVTVLGLQMLLLLLGGATAPPSAASHVKYMTFYDANATEQESWCTLLTSTPKCPKNASADCSDNAVSNETNLIQAWRDYGLPGLLDVEDIGGGFNAGLYIRGGFNRSHPMQTFTHLNPKWQAMLGGILDSALPFIEQGAIQGIFMGDEPCCGGLPAAELGTAADFIKAKIAHTDAFIYVNECERTFLGDCNPNGTCVPYAGLMKTVPDSIDIISADIYEINKGYEADAARKVYTQHIYPALAPHQRVMQVPGLFADARLSNVSNSKTLLEKVNGFWEWAQNDSRVVGLNPWHWNTWGSTFDKTPQFKLGAREFPAVVDRLHEIGSIIKQSAGGGGYGGRGHLLPTSESA